MYQFDGLSKIFENHMKDKYQNNLTMETILFTLFQECVRWKKLGFCVIICLMSNPINPWYINYSLVPQFLIKNLIKIDPVHQKEII